MWCVLINQFVSQLFAFVLHHVFDMAHDENMRGPIRTRNVGAEID